MAEIQPPLYVDVDLQYQAKHLGLPLRDVLSEGVLGATDLKVSERAAGGANMSVDVAAGSAYVLGDDSVVQPNYRVRSDSIVNLAVPAADATNARKDIVVAEVLDLAFDGGAQRIWRLRLIAGTPAAVPAEPALPNTALRLATVDVPALDTTIANAQITDRRPVVLAGGGGGLPAGPPYHHHVMTNENVPGLGFTNTATDGPMVVVAHRGDYFALGKCTFRVVDSAAFYTPLLGVGIGDFVAPNAADESRATPPQAGNAAGACSVMATIEDVPAGATIKLRYANSASGKANVEHRSLAVWPV